MLVYVDLHHLHALYGIGKRDMAYTGLGSMAHLICQHMLLALVSARCHSPGLSAYTNGPNVSGPTYHHMAYSYQILPNGANNVTL